MQQCTLEMEAALTNVSVWCNLCANVPWMPTENLRKIHNEGQKKKKKKYINKKFKQRGLSVHRRLVPPVQMDT